MSKRQMFLGVAGLVLAVIGLAALWLPMDLDQHDAYGFPIKCGNGFSSQAVQADGGDLIAKCDTALLMRRIWAIPSVAIGWLLVTVFLIAWVRAAPETQPTETPSASGNLFS